MNEFELIEKFFNRSTRRKDVTQSIGNDAAVLKVPDGQSLIITVDTLIEDVHFNSDINPEDLGYRCLAVNLSDLAAMGATPAWITLALTLPAADEPWLTGFANGLFSLADEHEVALVGGDTTRGKLSVTIQAMGYAQPSNIISRKNAQPTDLIYITGAIGDAGLALLALQNELRLPLSDKESVMRRFERPTARIKAGKAAAGIASSGIDVSDGLLQDLQHICSSSGVGATIYVEQLPLSPAVRSHFDSAGGWHMPLTAGDDYELLLTVPEDRQAEFENAMALAGETVTWIGAIDSKKGVRCLLPDGSDMQVSEQGYKHF